MPHPIDYTVSFSTTATLAAATATDVDIPIDGATDWSIVVKNTGGTNAVTALTIAISHATLFEAPASITTGIPLAAGATLSAIRGSDEPCKTARLTLTSTGGTTVSIEAGGR